MYLPNVSLYLLTKNILLQKTIHIRFSENLDIDIFEDNIYSKMQKEITPFTIIQRFAMHINLNATFLQCLSANSKTKSPYCINVFYL